MKASADNRILVGVLAAGGVVILILLSMTLGGGDETEPVKSFTVPCRIEPAWQQSPAPADPGDGNPSGQHEIRVYLDTSHPMGGYLAPQGVDAEPAFSSVAQLVPGHLVSRYSGAVRWFGIDSTLHPLPGNLHLTRGLFNGSETRLDLALDDIVSALESGKAEVAVLVSDLVSTSGPEGAMGAVEPILQWNRTAGVEGGRFDLGLLGVRADYWGVTPSHCSGPGPLGCWYSEQANRYIPMTKAAKRPLYFLFFGIRGGERGDDGSRVEEAGRSFQAALDGLGFETRWELLTAASRGRSGNLVCSAYRVNQSTGKSEAQFALVRESDGLNECRRDEKVLLSCCIAGSEAADGEPTCDGSGASVRSANASWDEVTLRAEGGRLEAVVDCEALRRKAPEKPLLLDDVIASATKAEPGPWKEWAASTDEVEESLSGTLQMDLFVETVRLRPDHYRIELQRPLLRFAP